MAWLMLKGIMNGIAGVLKGWESSRTLRAQSNAAHEPQLLETQAARALAKGIKRLAAGSLDDNVGIRILHFCANRFFVPARLRTPNLRFWISDLDVQRSLHKAALCKVFDNRPPDELLVFLISEYEKVSFEETHIARDLINSCIAFLAETLSAAGKDEAGNALTIASTIKIIEQIENLSRTINTAHSNSTIDNDQTEAMMSSVPWASWQHAFTCASRDLITCAPPDDTQRYLHRPEFDVLVSTVDNQDHSTIALLGVPGAGKSTLMGQLAGYLKEEKNVTVLGIKADLLGNEVNDEERLRQALNLPELPSRMIRELATKGPVALLIDQVDALAALVDLNTGRLSTLLNLIRALDGIPGVFVFVSCREFELKHDTRLRAINARKIELQLPPWQSVLKILTEHGIKQTTWPSDARAILRVPQHLAIYLELSQEGVNEVVSNYATMLDTLWSTRLAQHSTKFRTVALALEIAEIMAQEERLVLASARFDDRQEELERLKATGLLISSRQGSVQFAHQTIYEHALARGFAAQQQRLSDFVLQRNDSLFIRPKLWAALAYLRSVEKEMYEDELKVIWKHLPLRRHLQFLLIEFVGSQTEPSDTEQTLLVQRYQADTWKAPILSAITGSPGWFQRLHSTLIPKAMGNATLCAPLLTAAWEHSPDRVMQLITHYWLPQEQLDMWTLAVLQHAPSWPGNYVDTAITILKRARKQKLRIDSVIEEASEKSTEVAILLMCTVLQCDLDKKAAKGRSMLAIVKRELLHNPDQETLWWLNHNPLNVFNEYGDNEQNWILALDLAKQTPGQYLDIMWPWFLKMFMVYLELSLHPCPGFVYPLDFNVDFCFNREKKAIAKSWAFTRGLAEALGLLARRNPAQLMAWAEKNSHIEIAPVQRLIAYALGINPSATADLAYQFLSSDDRRFLLGPIPGDSSTTLNLVTACAPYWCETTINRYIRRVLKFKPLRPEGTNQRHWIKGVQQRRKELLSALPEDLRPASIKKWLDDSSAQNILDPLHSNAVNTTEVSFDKASAQNVINLFRARFQQNMTPVSTRFAPPQNYQLVQAFSQFAARDPERATEIIAGLESEFGQTAAGAALEAMAEIGPAEKILKLVVLLNSKGFNHELDYRVPVVSAIGLLQQRSIAIPLPVVDALRSWLDMRAPEDKKLESACIQTKNYARLLDPDRAPSLTIYTELRLLEIIFRAHIARQEQSKITELIQAYLALQKDQQFWEGIARLLAEIPAHECIGLEATVGDVLLLNQLQGRPGAAMLIASAQRYAPAEVILALKAWKACDKNDAQGGYGELITCLAFEGYAASTVARELLNDLMTTAADPTTYVGVVTTLLHRVWVTREMRAEAIDQIVQLLAIGNDEVWYAIQSFLERLSVSECDEYVLRIFQAMAEHAEQMPYPLYTRFISPLMASLLPENSAIVMPIAFRIIELWREEIEDLPTAPSRDAADLMDLALTLHRTEETRMQGVALFEELIDYGVYTSAQTLLELDNRQSTRNVAKRRQRKKRSL
ncbi:hypothetical protein ACW9IF_17330 [Pseudomonas tolaasii]